MKKLFNSRISFLILNFLFFFILFLLQKPIFMLFHWNETVDAGGLKTIIQSTKAGIPMDLSMSGYTTIIPALVLLVSVFSIRYLRPILKIYYLLISIFVAVIFIPDLVLYKYWGFRVDASVLNYISSPQEAIASTSGLLTSLVIIFALLYAAICYITLKKCLLNYFPSEKAQRKTLNFCSLLILSVLLFVLIRGGLTTATMNLSRVFYSKNTYLNHSAINPVFNFLYSLELNDNFDDRYRFMPDKEAEEILKNMLATEQQSATEKVLNTNRPNITIIILESFGRQLLESLGGQKDVAPNLDQLSKEGVFFPQLFASSFRTDRGVVAALAGYPAQPTMSILKYTKKTESLPSLHKSLIKEGYKGSFLYGGDSHFAHIKTLFSTHQLTDITQDKDFPLQQRITKWGVPDAYTFEHLLTDIEQEKEQPFLKIFLSLSSHEPFDVPTNKFDDPYLNSVAYTDSCIGVFIDKLKASSAWKNSLIVFIPDHNMRYPYRIENFSPERQKSFMLWLGGAIKEPKRIEKICSQIDLSKTILSQLGYNTDEFSFSKDILSEQSKEFAFYTFSDGLGLISDKGKFVYDCAAEKTLISEGEKSDSLALCGKAFLQSLFRDIARR